MGEMADYDAEQYDQVYRDARRGSYASTEYVNQADVARSLHMSRFPVGYVPRTVKEWAEIAKEVRLAHFEGRPHNMTHCKFCRFEEATNKTHNTTQETALTSRRELQDQPSAAIAVIASLQRQVDRLAKWPDEDPLQDGTIFYFEKAWPSNPDG